MEVTSTTKFVRLSPKKARDVAREIQGLPVSHALDILNFTTKKAAFLIGKTLRTAIADAENNFALDANSLMIKEAVVNAGPTMRRFKPRAKGSAGAIIKRTSHISVTLVGALPEKKKRAPKKAAPAATKPAPAVEKPAPGDENPAKESPAKEEATA